MRLPFDLCASPSFSLNSSGNDPLEVTAVEPSRFTAEAVPPGEYWARVECAGLAPWFSPLVRIEENRLTEVNWSIESPGEVVAEIVDRSGRGHQLDRGEQIEATLMMKIDEVEHFASSKEVVGSSVLFEAIHSGEYVITIRNPLTGELVAKAPALVVSDRQTRVVLNIEPSKTRSIRGNVMCQGSRRPPQPLSVVFLNAKEQASRVGTGSDGSFHADVSIPGPIWMVVERELAATTLRMHFVNDHGRYEESRLLGENERDLVVLLERCDLAIHGSVVSQDASSSFRVELHHRSRLANYIVGDGARLDEKGQFEFSGLPFDTFELRLLRADKIILTRIISSGDEAMISLNPE